MRGLRTARAIALVASAAVALTISGCGGAKVGETSGASAAASASGGGGAECGTFNIAINPWVGYEADAAVVAYVAERDLKCKVVKKDLKEEIAWQGFGSGEVDVVLENWGHPDLVKKYIDEQKTAVDAGLTGNKGVIGWYVPPWMAEEYPDITDWRNLKKRWPLFKTDQSGSKGQFLAADPTYVTNDEALVRNLGMNFTVVYAGSEDKLIAAFRAAEKDRTPLLGYFYSPQWLLSEIKLVHIALPEYTPGCDADPKTVACDYQPYDLDKIMSKKFAYSGNPAAELIQNFEWTNDDQNQVASDITDRKMTPAAAAKKWLDAHPEAWKKWVPATG